MIFNRDAAINKVDRSMTDISPNQIKQSFTAVLRIHLITREINEPITKMHHKEVSTTSFCPIVQTGFKHSISFVRNEAENLNIM